MRPMNQLTLASNWSTQVHTFPDAPPSSGGSCATTLMVWASWVFPVRNSPYTGECWGHIGGQTGEGYLQRWTETLSRLWSSISRYAQKAEADDRTTKNTVNTLASGADDVHPLAFVLYLHPCGERRTLCRHQIRRNNKEYPGYERGSCALLPISKNELGASGGKWEEIFYFDLLHLSLRHPLNWSS